MNTLPIRRRTCLALPFVPAFGRAAEPLRPPADLAWRRVEVMDNAYRGVALGSVAVPERWAVENRSVWALQQLYHPFRGHLHVAAPDGAAFADTFPQFSFMWASGAVSQGLRPGPSALGPIHSQPSITAPQALWQAVVQPFRGARPGLKVVGWRAVPPLPGAVAARQQGDSIVMRVHYQEGADAVEEDFYAFFENVFTATFRGPMGVSYEHHRWLRYVHSVGARGGRLAAWYPALAYVHGSMQPDPRWLELHGRVYEQINLEFQIRMQRGWDSIRAAGEASRAISARNDQMIASLRAQRAATDGSRERLNRGFSEYIRGVERQQDADGRVHEVNSGASYYWKSAQGTILGTNSTADPNVGSTTSWQPLTPAR